MTTPAPVSPAPASPAPVHDESGVATSSSPSGIPRPASVHHVATPSSSKEWEREQYAESVRSAFSFGEDEEKRRKRDDAESYLSEYDIDKNDPLFLAAVLNYVDAKEEEGVDQSPIYFYLKLKEKRDGEISALDTLYINEERKQLHAVGAWICSNEKCSKRDAPISCHNKVCPNCGQSRG